MGADTLDTLVSVTVLSLVVGGVAAVIAWFGRGRRGLLAGGLALLVIAFVPPLGTLAGHSLLTAHLIQVTIVMGFAPPLLLLGLPERSDRRLPRWASRCGSAITQPVVAIIVVNGLFFAWHAAGPFNAALRHPSLYALQIAGLLLASLAFWWPIVGPRASAKPGMSPFQKLGYILFATIPQTFAGMTVALAAHPLYSAYLGVPRELGLSLMSDQQIAGACMALVSKVALFAAFSVVLVRMFGEEAEQSDGDGGGGGGGGPAPDMPAPVSSPTATPDWLALLETDTTAAEKEREPAAAGRS